MRWSMRTMKFSGANMNITLATFDDAGSSTGKFNVAQTGTWRY